MVICLKLGLYTDILPIGQTYYRPDGMTPFWLVGPDLTTIILVDYEETLHNIAQKALKVGMVMVEEVLMVEVVAAVANAA